MAQKVSLTTRCDEHIKTEADRIYKELGMTLSTAVNMFLVATVKQKGYPIPMTTTEDSATPQDSE